MGEHKAPRRFYTAEYKRAAVTRMEERRAEGVSVAQVARELGVRPSQLREWAAPGGASTSTPGTAEAEATARSELRRLQRENRLLQEEVDFLKKAAAYFAKGSP